MGRRPAKKHGVEAMERTELTEKAHGSTELLDLLAADLHIYRCVAAIFKQQTAEFLGIMWD